MPRPGDPEHALPWPPSAWEPPRLSLLMSGGSPRGVTRAPSRVSHGCGGRGEASGPAEGAVRRSGQLPGLPSVQDTAGFRGAREPALLSPRVAFPFSAFVELRG